MKNHKSCIIQVRLFILKVSVVLQKIVNLKQYHENVCFICKSSKYRETTPLKGDWVIWRFYLEERPLRKCEDPTNNQIIQLFPPKIILRINEQMFLFMTFPIFFLISSLKQFVPGWLLSSEQVFPILLQLCNLFQTSLRLKPIPILNWDFVL